MAGKPDRNRQYSLCRHPFAPTDEVAWLLPYYPGMATINRTEKVRRVYAELRRAQPEDTSAHELLRISAKLVELSEGREDRPLARQGTPRPTFEELPLDTAFNDGGWRVMEYESRRMAQLYHDETATCLYRAELAHFGVEMTI